MALSIRLLSFCVFTFIAFVLLASFFPALFPQFSFFFLLPLAFATSFLFQKSTRHIVWIFTLLIGEMVSPLPFGILALITTITLTIYAYIHEHYVTNQRATSRFFLGLFMAFLFFLLFLFWSVSFAAMTTSWREAFIAQTHVLSFLLQELFLFALGYSVLVKLS